MSRIELVAKRQEDLHGGKPDYHVYAGAQLVGRIYQTRLTGSSESWFWGVNAVTFGIDTGAVMHGHAADLDDSKATLRAAFDLWLGWARAMPSTDLSYQRVAEGLKKMGAV